MYTTHTYCRACGFGKEIGPSGIKSAANKDRLVPVFSLGIQPLPNDFKSPGDVYNGFAPLEVLYCPKCTLAQLSVVIDPAVLYQNYAYVTSGSATMRNHFDRMWHALCIDAGREMQSVIEIGSNDGKLLNYLKERGVTGVGIDPAANLAQSANDSGARTVTGFFSEETKTEAMRILGGAPDCILARHVMCHVDDWQTFIRLVSEMCGPQTVVAIEIPNAVDMLNGLQFDTIYHEHLSYMSVRAMEALVKNTGLHLAGVHQYTLHGGTFVLVLRTDQVAECIDTSTWASPSLLDWSRFKDGANQKIKQMTDTVRVFRGIGKRVVGFGASAKSTVWLNACGFKKQDIQFITDNTPFKQGKFSPGTDVPIVDEGAILRDLPDYAIMFAWNYRNEILQTQAQYIQAGGKFIVPMPRIEII